jgi:uncharacterized lipoprotein YehR (DUF1307 family)
MSKILFTLSLLLTLISCGESTTQKEQKAEHVKRIAGWEIFTADDYSIQYPKDWELNESGQMGTRFILYSALENDDDKFLENVNLIVQDLQGRSVDLDAFTEISEEQVKTMLTNCTLYESERMKKGSTECHKLVYTADQGAFNLKFEQYYWVENEKAYVLTLTCEQSKFSNFKEVGEKILNSFSLEE